MISLADVYKVLAATVPLYAVMIIAYISVRKWKLFTPEQCSGINKFVAKFSIPLLSFLVISNNDPYHMSLKLIFADSLQKLFALLVFAVFNKLNSRVSLDWTITGFSLTTLPNTLILGIPILRAMYGEEAAVLLAQIVGLQSLIWYNLLLFLFEFRATEAVSETSSLETTGDLEGPHETQSKEGEGAPKARIKRKIKIQSIILTVGSKLITNPNTHATLAGLIWALFRFRWALKLPEIISKSITILSDGGLGMAMFSLGLFMASQTSIIACGPKLAVLALGARFLVGPSLMTAASLAIGLRGTHLRIAILQAALPQGIVTFVFAKEYNLHPDIMSTGVIFGMLITLPIALGYYILFEL